MSRRINEALAQVRNTLDEASAKTIKATYGPLLFWACRENKSNVFSHALKHCLPYINELKNEDDSTILERAACYGRPHFVQMLLAAGAKPSEFLVHDVAAIERPVMPDGEEIIKDADTLGVLKILVLLDPNALTRLNPNGQTPLHAAIRRQANLTAVRYLSSFPETFALKNIPAQWEIEYLNAQPRTPLQLAAEMSVALTSFGRERYLTAEFVEIAFTLINAGANTAGAASVMIKKLFETNRIADPQLLKALLEKNPLEGAELLLEATKRGNINLVAALLAAGISPHVQDADGYTPLHTAAYNGYLAVVELLLDKSADPTRQDHQQKTALYRAAIKEHIEVIAKLITAGAGLWEGQLAAARLNKEFSPEILAILDAQETSMLTNPFVCPHLNFNGFPQTRIAEVENYLALLAAHYQKNPDQPRTLKTLGLRGLSLSKQALHHLAGILVQCSDWNFHWNFQVMPTPSIFRELLKAFKTFFPSEQAKIFYKKFLKLSLQTLPPAGTAFLLNEVAKDGDTDAIAAFLTAGVDPNVPDADGKTPLHFAAVHGDFKATQLLLAKSALPDAEDKDGYTPLYIAAFEGHTEVAQCLTTAGANVNVQSGKGHTALHAAAMNGHIPALNLLLPTQNANLDLQDDERCTALYLAAAKGNIQATRLLLTAGASLWVGKLPEARFNKEFSPEILAILDAQETSILTNPFICPHLNFNGFPQTRVAEVEHCLGILADYKKNPNHAGILQFSLNLSGLIFSKQGFQHLVELEMSTNAGSSSMQISISFVYKRTLLHVVAAMYGDIEATQLLVAKGIFLEAQDTDGRTALIGAAFKGHTAVVQCLTSAGANVNAQSKEGYTALHGAACGGHIQILQCLIANGALLDIQNEKGNTPLHEALSFRQNTAADLLIAAGADLFVTNKNGDTLLHSAATRGQIDVVRILLAADISPNAKNRQGETPLHLSAQQATYNRDNSPKFLAITELLLTAGADPDAVDNWGGNTPLFLAASNRQFYNAKTMEALHAAGAGIWKDPKLAQVSAGTSSIWPTARALLQELALSMLGNPIEQQHLNFKGFPPARIPELTDCLAQLAEHYRANRNTLANLTPLKTLKLDLPLTGEILQNVLEIIRKQISEQQQKASQQEPCLQTLSLTLTQEAIAEGILDDIAELIKSKTKEEGAATQITLLGTPLDREGLKILEDACAIFERHKKALPHLCLTRVAPANSPFIGVRLGKITTWVREDGSVLLGQPLPSSLRTIICSAIDRIFLAPPKTAVAKKTSSVPVSASSQTTITQPAEKEDDGQGVGLPDPRDTQSATQNSLRDKPLPPVQRHEAAEMSAKPQEPDVETIAPIESSSPRCFGRLGACFGR